ncbi:MAG: FHA domain-containing protein [Dehalococcoidia bacterium]|jgi:hypothetical protein
MRSSYYLKITRGGEMREHFLDQPVITIGRGADSSIRLDDENVSRRHAEIEWAEGRPRITDMGSSNGTQVNGVKIGPHRPVSLKEGDTIGIGGYLMTVRTLPVADKTAASAPAERPVTRAGTPATSPLQRVSKSRKNSYIIMAVGIVVIIGAIVAASLLLPGNNDEIIEESATCLIEEHARAIMELDKELEEVDNGLYTVKEDLLKLDQVVSPCMEWIDIQRKDSQKQQKRSSWQYAVDQEGLDTLKNDRYEVTKLEYSVRNVGLPEEEETQVIEVVDLNSGSLKERAWDDIEADLNKKKQNLEQEWDELLEKREMAMSTMEGIDPYWVECDVEKINSTTYILSGKGMGWSNGFADGKWTFYRDRNEIIPADSRSEALLEILVPEI